jgi:hypothetical protein
MFLLRMRRITIGRARTWHYRKMPQPFALLSGSGTSSYTRSLADFITTMSGFRFSVHIGAFFKSFRAYIPFILTLGLHFHARSSFN